METESDNEAAGKGCKRPAPLSARSSPENEVDSGVGDSSDSSDQHKASSGGSDSKAANEGTGHHPQDTTTFGGTYPEPSTFAERVMHVLENNLAPRAIWWVDDGEGIALHPGEMNASGILDKFFSRNRFATFVRTLTRWGFKRVSDYNLPDDALGLRNSLFQRDRPQLVQYMMMDSDVQDVFEEHQKRFAQQPVDVSGAAHDQNLPDAQSLVRHADTIVQGTTSHSTSVATSSTLSHSPLGDSTLIALRTVIQHTQDFLNMTQTAAEGTETLRGIMQLLVVEGERYLQQHQETKPPIVPAATGTAPQQTSQQPGQPQVVPDLNFFQQLMWFQFQLQQQQSQSSMQLQPQVQGIPFLQQQQPSQQTQTTALVPNWQLLHGLVQMQQQQQQQQHTQQDSQNQQQDKNT